MAELELRLNTVAEHGLPYACITCGSDEHPHLVSKKLQKGSGLAPLGCIFFFMGPLGWLVILIIAFAMAGRSKTVSLPFCDQCIAAGRALRNRTFGLVIIGMGSIVLSVTHVPTGVAGWVATGGGLLTLYALIEYAMLSKQFDVKTVKVESDRVLLDVPDDDYPGLYQRHLDTALLYGSSDSLGAEIDDEF